MRRSRFLLLFCLVCLVVPFAAKATPLPSTFYFRLTGDNIPGFVTFQVDSHASDQGSGVYTTFAFDHSYNTDVAVNGTVLGTAVLAAGTYTDTTSETSYPAFALFGPNYFATFTNLQNVGDFYFATNSYTYFELGSYSLASIGGFQTLEVGDSPFVAATPEPSSLLLLGTGVVGAAGAFRRRFVRA